MIVRFSRFILLLLCSALLPACTVGMRAKFDAAWETVDPMGHRSEHQSRNYPRGRTTGIRLPGDADANGYRLPGSTQ
jgi:hypothetical protein